MEKVNNEKNFLTRPPLRSKNRQQLRKDTQELLERTILKVKPVSKTTKGGRQRRFVALVLVKREKSIAFGYARHTEAGGAIEAAAKQAKRKLVTYFKEAPRTIPYDFCHSFKSTTIYFRPAPAGSGIIAGETVSLIFKYLGIQDLSAKIIGSNNMKNVVECTFEALNRITKRRNN